MAYLKSYGTWALDESGRKPDLTRCCESVYSLGDYISRQCARKNGHGPDGAYCKQHDPDAVRAREAQSMYKYELQNYNRRMERLSSTLPLIQAIAQGHNDPRDLCQNWLDEMSVNLTPHVAPQEGET